MMNTFQLLGDLSHVLAIWILFFKFFTKSSAKGISGRTQFLFFLTYCMRYLDLATTYISLYNTSLKVFYILGSLSAALAIYLILRETYEDKLDTFRIEILLVPVTLLALYVSHEYSFIEVCWTWSIYMEAVALLPQVYMSLRGGHIDFYLISYLASLGFYRGFYIAKWAHRYMTEDGFYDDIASISGVVETSITALGLLLILVKYSGFCCFSETRTDLPSIYTLPFVTQGFARDYNLLKSEKPRAGQMNGNGPYNSNLSVPILHEDELA